MRRRSSDQLPAFEWAIIFVLAIAMTFLLVNVIFDCIDRQAVIDAKNLDSHLTLEQRKEIMGVKK